MNDKNFNYGVIKYNSLNIGDEIQSIAAMRFLPKIDEYILRDHISSYKAKNGKKTKLIMNAWWMWLPENFPPSADIVPLMTSMHIRKEVRTNFIKNKKIMNYLLEHSPIGCRDYDTYNWLKQNGVSAYFSGCLTLTLNRNNNVPREDYILCVDVDNKIYEEIKKRTNRPVYNLTRMISPCYTSLERFELAKLFLHLYHNAHCVVSPCLHAILPSAAFETPVLRLIEENEHMHVNSRFEGMEDWFNTATYEDFIRNKNIFDFENPNKNSDKYLEIRKNLIKECAEFTGYCSNESPIRENINLFVELLKLNTFTWEKNQKLLFFAGKTDLKNTIALKKRGVGRYTYEDGMPVYSRMTLLKKEFSIIKYNILSHLCLKKNNKLNSKYERKKIELSEIKSHIRLYKDKFNDKIY